MIAVAGVALLALGRGVLRGQRRAWRVAVVLLSATTVLHLAAGGDFEESLLAIVVLVLLVTGRKEFQAASDSPSLRSALVMLVAGVVGITLVTTASIELFTHLGHHQHPHIAWGTAFAAVSERLLGFRSAALPTADGPVPRPGPPRRSG